MGKRVQTDFLFAQPSFVGGVASIADFWGQLTEYNISDNGIQADLNALTADWCVVGQDISDALHEAQNGKL